MLDLTLTDYANSLGVNQLNFDGFILIKDNYINGNITEVSSFNLVSDIPTNCIVFECTETTGNIYYFERDNQVSTSCRVHIQDDSSNTYNVIGILFYTITSGIKRILAGFTYNVREIKYLFQKTEDPISLQLAFNPIQKIIKFVSTLAAPKTAFNGTVDGQVHIENEAVSFDDTYSVYNKPQIDKLLDDNSTHYCRAHNTCDVNESIVSDYRNPAPDDNHDNNPRYNGNSISLYVTDYISLTDYTKVNLYISNQTYTGSVGFLNSTDDNTKYNVYPIYFRGDQSLHNPTIPAGSMLHLTFYNNAFYANFYDLSDFGVDHEPMVRIGTVSDHVSDPSQYPGTLVAYQADTGKLDKFIIVSHTVSDGAITISESLNNVIPNSPIYVSFQGRCFSAHPKVPFGFITQVEYIYDNSLTLTYSNLKFYYLKNGVLVDDDATLQSLIVINPSSGLHYFHVDNAPVYINPSYNNGSSNIISIGGVLSDNSILLGYLLSGTENAGLIRLVECHFNDISHYAAHSGDTNKLVYHQSTLSTNTPYALSSNEYNLSSNNTVDIAKTTSNAVVPNKTTTYNLGSSTLKWNYVYSASVGSSSYPTSYIYTNTAVVKDSMTVFGYTLQNYIYNRLYNSSLGLFLLKINAKITNASYQQVINRGSSISFTSSYYTINSIKIARLYNNSSYINIVDPQSGYVGTTLNTVKDLTLSGTYILLTQLCITSTSNANYVALAIRTF